MTLDNALNLESGEELERFDLGTVNIRGNTYQVLTGYEVNEDVCWWCGKPIEQNKRHAHYCRGKSHDDFLSCFRQYHEYFDWQYASRRSMRKAERKCQNCGVAATDIGTRYAHSNLEVHHIVPLKGSLRSFTAYNLPWNLIVLCHDCHQLAHAALRPPKTVRKDSKIDSWNLADKIGQSLMAISIESSPVPLSLERGE